jgi:hypothetical protein
VLKVVPAGAAGEIAKLAMVPPVEVTVYPAIALLTVLVSAVDESVNAGAATEEELDEDEVDAGGTYAGVVTGSEASES